LIAAEPETKTIIDPETGAIFDPETGEILGYVDQPLKDTEDTETLIRWLGERKLRVAAKLAGIHAEREAWIDKINDQYDSKIKALDRELEYLTRNPDFVTRLKTYAAEKLAGAKTRTLKTGLLKLSFRAVPGGLKVTDKDAALAYVQEHDELVDRCVTISYNLRATDYVALKDEIEDLPGIENVPDRETFSIDGEKVAVDDVVSEGE
jgi:phage host-nuclease inhibitor protein Gam